MDNSFLFTVTLLFLCNFASKEVYSDSRCTFDSSADRVLSVSISRRRNQTEEWVTTFSARRESNESSEIYMDVDHRVTKCQGRNIVQIQGVIREMYEDLTEEKLRFHPRCGTNVRITNNGRTAEKINLNAWDNSVTFTNRMLKDDEIFELRLDVKNDKYNDAIGIGVTMHSPDKIGILNHMNNMRSGTWMLYLTNVYKDGSSIKSNYMKDLKEIKVGDTFGVKRTAAGNLHLLINGVDQGVAAPNVPSELYGVFELYYGPAKATIIDKD